MSSWLSYITGSGSKDTSASAGKARNAIIELRQQLLMIDKQEEHMMKKIDDENQKAKLNATTNKRAALAALRNKKTYEGQLDRLTGTRMTLETQMNALESANMNLQTMEAMKRGSEALKGIHGKMNIDKVAAMSFSSPSSSDFSVKTIVIAGIECDVYGLKELKGNKVAVIFVAHGRNNDRSSMTKYCQWLLKSIAFKAKAAGKQDKQLVVINLDQRNHGSRAVHPLANFSFAPAGSSSDSGNETHAIDMYAMQTGTARDISHLIDFVPSYLFPHGGPPQITDFFVTGFSMGGHVAWLLLRHEPRISLGIPIVGCPDYLSLLNARGASLSPPICTTSSTHFPPSLLALIATNDPVSTFYSSRDPLLNPFLGKKILAISGRKDKIVPVSFTEPFFADLEVGEGGKKELWMFDGGHVQTEEAMEHAAEFVWREGLN